MFRCYAEAILGFNTIHSNQSLQKRPQYKLLTLSFELIKCMPMFQTMHENRARISTFWLTKTF